MAFVVILFSFFFVFNCLRFKDSKKSKFFNRSSSLKQSIHSTTQPSVDLNVTGQSAMAMQPGQQQQHHSQQPSTPKKSNWEVIEHFNTSAKSGKAVVSSSLIAVRIKLLFHLVENAPDTSVTDLHATYTEIIKIEPWKNHTTQHFILLSLQAGITRCNIDESIDSTNSSSTCHSPMTYQRDEAQLLQASKLCF